MAEHQVETRTIKMTGIARIRALAIHKDESASPRILSLSPLTAANIPIIPPVMAIEAAMRPRLRQPINETGRDAMMKKMTGTVAGIIRCLMIFFMGLKEMILNYLNVNRLWGFSRLMGEFVLQ